MARNVITADPSSMVIFAADMMGPHRIGALPVLASDGDRLHQAGQRTFTSEVTGKLGAQ